MLDSIASSVPFFGVFVTAAVYLAALKLQQKTKLTVLNPIIVSSAAIIVLLLVTGISFEVFAYGRPLEGGRYDGTGASLFQVLLTPTTVCLAIPLYEKLSYLKKYPIAIFGGITAGAVTAVGSVLAIKLIFGLTHEQYVTLLPKSVTTAIGMSLSESFGGLVPVTVLLIALTGVTGSVIASFTMKLFRIFHPVAKGLALGTSAHAIGTTRAREFGEVEEAMSGLSIAVCGLITVVLATIMATVS